MNATKTVRLTTAQALVRFLANQHVERDGVEQRFFAGCFGIFGHGNVAGVGQALHEYSDELTYYQPRNEQAMVHTASAYARMKNRLSTFACTTSIGPGATNMVTGAALATINRLPVLLLPGDVFASRAPDPVLQQLESAHDGTLSVNDCFRPVSKYFDRVYRPEQIIPAAMSAMRVLTDQAETGAVTLSLPQDVQTEAHDFPEEFFEKRVWRIGRPLPHETELERAAAMIRNSGRPMIVAGGGVIYSEAAEVLRRFVETTGVPVGETQAGKGSMPYDHPCVLGAVGATGTFAANRVAREADVVIGVGTRWSDFTTASKTAFKNPDVRFVNINVASVDAHKHSALPLTGDARRTLEALSEKLSGFRVDDVYRDRNTRLSKEWDEEVERLYTREHEPLPAQSAVIGAVNTISDARDVVVCAAGSMPGDLHKLWRTRDPKGYHVEYGYSCMGYEISGGLGVKMADPEREVYVMVGDGSYLMMSSEIITSIQEGYKLTIVLVDNSGFSSIGALSRSVGSQGFGTQYRYRENGSIGLDEEGGSGDVLPVDLAKNAEGFGATVMSAQTVGELKEALEEAKKLDTTVVIHVPVDRYEGVPDYESFWDVPVAEVSGMESVRIARKEYEENRRTERRYL
ncbi:MAG: 3D-(3,5/4)-trihydroxycyclohexane-1,2-dione acylhydrolase (decyclizing) [Rubrobacteraceae bacterium]|jgi:3D-(3,5/4)-trihydroxycyclohexane-1,2-dione acylhydrolase (decyclizing)|nr:3D-(3,5/4)-trihydroxycyclohexane-1,2-dione acylhydrolase (decyclizing) [Rubrobacter sp.]